MRKIETIKNEIERAQARVVKNSASRDRLVTRFENAKAKAIKLGWDYKGDGQDAARAPWGAVYSACRSADDALESIKNKEAAIQRDHYAINSLTDELAEVVKKLEAVPQAIKDYEVDLREGFIADRKFRRSWAQGEIQERKENGEWVTVEDLRAKWEELGLSEVRSLHDPKWGIYQELKDKRNEQENLKLIASESDESIEKGARDDARALILDLNSRVSGYVGEATDCSGLKVTRGTHGCAVLNGIVIGSKGRCEVKSKGVAGYNIVRWHIRVNVLPVRA